MRENEGREKKKKTRTPHGNKGEGGKEKKWSVYVSRKLDYAVLPPHLLSLAFFTLPFSLPFSQAYRTMSDPTYVEGWNLQDPMDAIRRHRTDIELIAMYNMHHEKKSV